MLDLTPIEQKALDALLAVRDMWVPKMKREAFMDLMGEVRDAISALENKKYGCLSGRHTGKCTCTANRTGISVQWGAARKMTAVQ